MASSAENRVVNLAGLVQGITLVTFPAAGTIFTDPTEYDLSNTQYGAMFLPQVLTAIATSLLGARLAARFGSKQVLLLGLLANISAMLVLVLSTAFEGDPAAYPLLLLATGLLGAGFGLTVPVLNTYAAAFQPDRPDRAVLTLNALLGLGTALAPVFVAVFVGLGFWWGLPAPVDRAARPAAPGWRAACRSASSGRRHRGAGGALGGIPARFWLFAGFAVLYGVCETMNGNWSEHDMTASLRRLDHPGGAGPDGVLGHGHRGPPAVRGHRPLAAAADRLPGPAGGARGHVRPHRLAPGTPPRRGESSCSPSPDWAARPCCR